jgi:hypothetical protein
LCFWLDEMKELASVNKVASIVLSPTSVLTQHFSASHVDVASFVDDMVSVPFAAVDRPSAAPDQCLPLFPSEIQTIGLRLLAHVWAGMSATSPDWDAHLHTTWDRAYAQVLHDVEEDVSTVEKLHSVVAHWGQVWATLQAVVPQVQLRGLTAFPVELQSPAAIVATIGIIGDALPTFKKDVSIEGTEWQLMINSVNRFRWNSLSLLLDLVHASNTLLPPKLTRSLLQQCIDTLDFVGPDFTTSVFRCLRTLLPAAALQRLPDGSFHVDIDLIREAFDTAWVAVDSIECIGDATSVNLFTGFLHAATAPEFFECEVLHRAANGPVYHALDRVMQMGISRSIRSAHALAAALMPVLLQWPQLLDGDHYASIVSEVRPPPVSRD